MEKQKDREKAKVDGRLVEKKGDRDLEREIKKTRETFFCRENDMKIL